MTESNSNWMKRHSLVTYFVLAYGITWILSILATEGLLPFQLPAAITIFSVIVLHYGPSLAAIIVAGIVGGKAGARELLGRLREWRVGIHWYLFVLLFPTILRLTAVGLDVLLGGTLPKFASADIVPEGIHPLLLLVPVFVGALFQAGIAEEIGWRGYALPKLQTRSNALVSSLILGLVWGLWHFHPQNWSILAPIGFWYMFLIIPFTIIFTWVYNNTKGSLLIAVLFHTASNTADWLVPTMPSLTSASDIRPFILIGGLNWITAIILVNAFGMAHLSRKPPTQT